MLLPPELLLLVDPLPPPEPLDEELPKGPPMGVSLGELHANPLATPTRKTAPSPKATFRIALSYETTARDAPSRVQAARTNAW